MPNQTENHQYNHPAKGTTDWHIPLNKNFERFDTDIEIRDADANRGNYTPKQGAKFLATDTEKVYLGDGSSWNELTTSGKRPSFDRLNQSGDFLGVGRNNPITPAEQFGIQTPAGSGSYGGMYINTSASGGWPFYGYATGGTNRVWHYYDGTTSEWKLEMPNGRVTVDTNGNLDATGNKNFVQTVDTDDGQREVVYTATEAGIPHTEASGVARLEDGRAEVDLPDHFAWVTSENEPLHVQVTPHSVESDGLAAVERSRHRIVVADLDGESAYEFSYTVKGTRDGHQDKDVVRDPR